MAEIEAGIRAAPHKFGEHATYLSDAAHAILTTDTHCKVATREVEGIRYTGEHLKKKAGKTGAT